MSITALFGVAVFDFFTFTFISLINYYIVIRLCKRNNEVLCDQKKAGYNDDEKTRWSIK
jgi:hypothetical protein